MRYRFGRHATLLGAGLLAALPIVAQVPVAGALGASTASAPARSASTSSAAPAAAGPAAASTGSTATAFGTTPVFADEFNGTSINNSVWSVYNTPTKPEPKLASNIVVHDGMATLKTVYSTALAQWSYAGMCACGPAGPGGTTQTYGKYEVLVRVSAGDSRICLLLWPKVGWPPEIDFMEIGGDGANATRQRSTQTVHYGTHDQNFQFHNNYDADMTAWHVVGMQWSPGLVQFTLDGVVKSTVASAGVSGQPMWMGIQTSKANRNATTQPVNLDIDWVHVYSYSGGTGTAPAAPAAPVATAGDASASVSWQPPTDDGNSPPMSYAVTASPGGVTKTISGANGGAPATSANFTGLTPGVDYSFTVTATNAFGTGPASPPSDPVTAGGAPPTITSGPTMKLGSHPTIGASSAGSQIATQINWTAVQGGDSKICSYEPQHSINGGAFTDLPWFHWSPTVAKDSVSAGDRVQYQVRATGCDGLVGAWTTGPPMTYQLMDETSPSVTYSGSWAANICAGCVNGTTRSTSTKGAGATVIVPGAYNLGLVATVGPNQSSAKLYVDGVFKTTLWLHSTSTATRRVVFDLAWTTAGTHTVAVVDDANAGHARLDMDAVLALTS